jgi:cellulose synthase/poly-beta-1,6-N-acetylglucosamine synthase-like glycosyltransferase
MTGPVHLNILFMVSLLAVFHAYFGYPVTLLIVGLFVNRRCVSKHSDDLRITLVIAAFNEERRIEAKIENTLAVEYPRDKIDIIVASDGSTDNTNELVLKYKEHGVRLIPLAERKGKENAQKEALKHSEGEVVVFTDVATMLDRTAVRQIVSNFADPTIGCVSSEDRVVGKDGMVSGESLYVGYEMWLRRLESGVSSPVGLSGSFFAARREICEDLPGDVDSDFGTVLNTVKRGLRGTCDPEAIGCYGDLSDRRSEFDRKVRTVLRGLTMFFHHVEFLNILKYGLFSYQYFCHKLLRWLVPFFMIAILVSNVLLAGSSNVFLVILLGQIVFYGAGWTAIWKNYYSTGRLLKIPAYFITVNASILVAWLRFIGGQRILTWTPSER